MKKTVLFILFVFIYSFSFSQTEKFKETKNIYLLDVTLSMFGYNNAPNIFDNVRNELINSINAIQNPKTEIVVVTFQDNILDTWTAYADDKGKTEIVTHLQNIEEKKLKATRTNIYSVWKKGQELVDPNKLNVMYLLTDGVQNTQKVNKNKLYNEVKDWGTFANNKDYYAFLVELVDNAKDEELRKVIKETPNAQVISGIDFFVFSVKDLNPIVSLYDDLEFDLDFVGDRIDNIPQDFSFTLKMNDNNFKLSETSFILKNKPFKIKLTHPNKSIETIQSIPKTEWFSSIIISYDKNKYPNVKLLNNVITLKIKNKKEMVLKIRVIEEE